jgi:quinohemoprotein ethanol dehydrogenase
LHAPKNGFFYVLDRKNGQLISANNFTQLNWAAGIDGETGRPVEYPEARYSESGLDFMAEPAAFGSHNWHPMAYSRKTGLVYLPAQEIPRGYKLDKNYVYRPGHGSWNIGVASNLAINIGPQYEAERINMLQSTKGELIAWDPIKQKEVWRVQHPSVGAGGVLATAGNLVFQGTPDGVFHAYAADTGLEVWHFDGQIGIIAGAMSYAIDGQQYIAVLSGLGGSNGVHVPYMGPLHAGSLDRSRKTGSARYRRAGLLAFAERCCVHRRRCLHQWRPKRRAAGLSHAIWHAGLRVQRAPGFPCAL